MKLKVLFFWLISIFLPSEFFAMDHVPKINRPQKLHLSEIVVESSQDEDIIQLMYEALLEKKMAKKRNVDNQVRTPRQVVGPIKNQLYSRVEAFKDKDPELYKLIMDFKTKAEQNCTSPREIENYIKQHLDELSGFEKKIYKDLYHAHVDKTEAVKKKDYDLHEVLDPDETVDHAALYHAVLYRSASVALGKNEIKKETDKTKKYADDWLEKVKEHDPNAYALLAQTQEQLKNKNQHTAAQDLLNAVDQVSNVELLSSLMKDIQNQGEVKEAADDAWSTAYKVIGVIIAGGATLVTSVGGTLGGLFGASKVPVAACTIAKCLALWNVTIPG